MSDSTQGRLLLLVLLAGLAGLCLISAMWFMGFDLLRTTFAGDAT